jgi:DNA-binding NtrC family response regulator
MQDGKRLVLVVDDEPDPRAFLFSLLESEGFAVATSDGALDAMKYVAGHHPDVVIADVRMPEIDGLELLVKVRYMSPGTRVILYTAYGDDRTRTRALLEGVAALLEKPSTPRTIVATVREALEAEAS